MTALIDLDKKQQPDGGLLLQWSGKSPTVVSTSLVVGSVVIVADWSGNLKAFEKSRGEALWKAKTAVVVEPMFMFDGLVWVFDRKGAVTGFDPETGSERARHEFANGGWSARQLGGTVLFLHQQSRAGGVRGAASALDLRTGRLEAFAEPGQGAQANYGNTLITTPGRARVAVLQSPDLTILSWPGGSPVATHHLRADQTLAGLIGYGDSFAAVVGQVRKPGETHEPDALLVAHDGAFTSFPLPVAVLGSLQYTSSVLNLDSRCFLLEIAEVLFLVAGSSVELAVPLPGRGPVGKKGAGLVSIGGRPHALQALQKVDVPDEQAGYYLQVHAVDPQTLVCTPVGRPFRTHPHGRNFKQAEVDAFGAEFVVRGDGRFHFMTAASD